MALTALGVVAFASAGACGSATQDCSVTGVARVCLSRSASARLSATGLEPGSPVIQALEGPSVDPGPPPPALSAGPDGRFPPPHTTSGVVIPAGRGPVTLRVTVTPRGGSATVVTFHRS